MAKPPSSVPGTVDDFGKKVKTHQRYYVEEETLDEKLTEENGVPTYRIKKVRVPGSTTITGMLPKPYLVRWANNLGLDGIESDAYRDETAAIGDVAHLLVQAFLLEPLMTDGEIVHSLQDNLKDYTQNQIERAMHAVVAFREWAAPHKWRTEVVEGRFVSQENRYGGTVDWYGEWDGRMTLLDFKTSKQVGIEHKVQITSYVKLLRENDWPVSGARVIRIPRNPNQGVVEHVITNDELKLCWDIFEKCKALYDLQKQWKKLA